MQVWVPLRIKQASCKIATENVEFIFRQGRKLIRYLLVATIQYCDTLNFFVFIAFFFFSIPFSKVFGPETTQSEFFEGSTKEIVRAYVNGVNGLVFTYGVTNAGKTYTIQGITYIPKSNCNNWVWTPWEACTNTYIFFTYFKELQKTLVFYLAHLTWFLTT